MSEAGFGKEHLAAWQIRAGDGDVILSKILNMAAKSPTAAEFRLACSQFATGVSVVTAERAPGRVHGMTANSVTSVSLNPLLLLVCVDHRAQLLPMAMNGTVTCACASRVKILFSRARSKRCAAPFVNPWGLSVRHCFKLSRQVFRSSIRIQHEI